MKKSVIKKLAITTIVITIIISSIVYTSSKATTELEKAKEIALKHANLKADQVSFIRAETDKENGVDKYSIEFYYEGKEYDYEINSDNGEIISYDFDLENYNIPTKEEENNTVNNQTSNNATENQSDKQTANNQSNNNETVNQTSNNGATSQESNSEGLLITLEEAKKIALNHAGLSSGEASFIKAEMDYDDGIKKYDIEFYYQNKEYDYEINSSNGEIIEYDYDVESYSVQNNQSSNNTGINQQENNATTSQQSNSEVTLITLEEAKQIALDHAGLSSGQASFIKAEMDHDDGIKKYEIEFYFNNIEYNYEIDANTGNILEYEQD